MTPPQFLHVAPKLGSTRQLFRRLAVCVKISKHIVSNTLTHEQLNNRSTEPHSNSLFDYVHIDRSEKPVDIYHQYYVTSTWSSFNPEHTMFIHHVTLITPDQSQIPLMEQAYEIHARTAQVP